MVVSESHNFPRRCCRLVGRRPHFLADRDRPYIDDTNIAACVASPAVSHCSRAIYLWEVRKLLNHESSR